MPRRRASGSDLTCRVQNSGFRVAVESDEAPQRYWGLNNLKGPVLERTINATQARPRLGCRIQSLGFREAVESKEARQRCWGLNNLKRADLERTINATQARCRLGFRV